MNEYAPAYQEYLDRCGEEIITKTVTFETVHAYTGVKLPNAQARVWMGDWTYKDNVFVMTIESDANGNGSFVIQMPKSLYDRTMEGKNGDVLAAQFMILGAGTGGSDRVDYSYGGTDFRFLGDNILHHYIQNNPYSMDLAFMPHAK